jgi:hypothetical protein
MPAFTTKIDVHSADFVVKAGIEMLLVLWLRASAKYLHYTGNKSV